MIRKLSILATAAFSFTALSTLSVAQDAAVAEAPAKKKDALSDIKHPLQPLLWKVEGNGLEKPSYLFGSMHVGDPRVTTLHPLAEKAFVDSDTVATEVDMGMVAQMKSMALMMRKEGSLQDDIGDELFKRFDEELKIAKAPMNAKAMNPMKTWAALLMLGSVEQMNDKRTPLDLVIWNRAGKDKKARWALETNAEHVGGFDTLTKDEQVLMMKDMLRGLKFIREEVAKGEVSPLVEMTNTYLKGNAKEIYAFSQQEDEHSLVGKELKDKFMKLLSDDRNVRMAETIEKKIKAEPAKSHFMVAGTLHYVGPNNVGDLLRKKGYKVTRIKADEKK